MNNLFPPAGPKVLSVSELTAQVKGTIEQAFSAVWVAGELTGFKRHQSGHWYFSMKDAGAVLPAAMFKGANLRICFEPKDGMEVVARGTLNVYPPQGKYQLIVQELMAKGLGLQELALQKLKEKLFKKGYFAPQRKRNLPRFPGRLALITSPTGAAVRDMLEILQHRWPALEIWLCPVRVQGDLAPLEIAAAFTRLNRLGGVDVIILGRGGGSIEDLAAFNDERVADAIFASAVPVVSAVGHEIDLTIADLVADQRALTPSHAAALVVPDRQEILQALREIHNRAQTALRTRLENSRRRLSEFAGRRVMRRPLDLILQLSQRLDDAHDRVQRAMKQRMEQRRKELDAVAGRLDALSPLNVLRRGYSLTRRADDGTVVRSNDQVRPGDLLVTRLQHGRIISRAEEIGPI